MTECDGGMTACAGGDARPPSDSPEESDGTFSAEVAPEEEHASEGYLILTFNKGKEARVKTAVFADVSDARFADDFDDDALLDDDEEEGDSGSPIYYRTPEESVTPSNETSNVTTVNVLLSDQNNNTTVLKPEPENSTDKKANFISCYGEALWIGENDVLEEMQPKGKPQSVDLSSDTGGSQSSTTRLSIRATCLTRLGSVSTSDVSRSRLAALATTANAGMRDPNSYPTKPYRHQLTSCRSPSFARRYTRPDGNTLYDHPYMLSRRLHPEIRLPLPALRSVNRLNGCDLNPLPLSFTGGSGLHCDGSLLTAPDSPASVTGSGSGSSGSLSRKMLRCDECGKYYRNEYSLHHHICLKRKDVWKKGDVPSELIDGQLVYFCPTCNKPFKWLGNLTRHFYVHTGQRFFRCDLCQKEFFSAYQVKRHMNSHTGMRFKCEVCEKPFTCKYACAWHTRQHYTYVE